MELPNYLSKVLIGLINKIGVVFPICTELYSDLKSITFKSVLPFFHFKLHIPPTVTTGELNNSPV